MTNRFEKYKGIHPGIVLARELEKRSLRQRPFALSIGEHPQTFNAITKGKRNINTAIALKIEKELQLEEGTLLILQAFYDIRLEKLKTESDKPELSLLRKSLFWDTDIATIDWDKQYRAIIQRVSERGNEAEKNEIARFYGKAKMRAALSAPKTAPYILHNSIA
jgi:plasmid maintenance system antidote protein VapI